MRAVPFLPRSPLARPLLSVLCTSARPAPLRMCASGAARDPVRGGFRVVPGSVYFVSTPIGNLEDITLRAVRTLREADVIASEDTRVTAALLRHLGIGQKRLLSHHDHNLPSSVPKLLEIAAGGESVAVVSDAGTPGISDPGRALAAACAERGVPLVPIPGPCAAVAALSVCGFGSTEFVFGGFVPRAGRARRETIAELAAERRAVVLYEAPHRLVSTLTALAEAGASERSVVCARELTKLHEELHRGSVRTAAEWYASVAQTAGKVRGEFTLVLAPLDAHALAERREEAQQAAADAAAELVAERLARGESVSRVARDVAAELGVPKQRVYAEALRQHRLLDGPEGGEVGGEGGGGGDDGAGGGASAQ